MPKPDEVRWAETDQLMRVITKAIVSIKY